MPDDAAAAVAFKQRMGKDIVIHTDRIERGGVVLRFDEIETIRYRMMQDFDTRDPSFEFAAADGRKIQLMELARMREIFGLVRGRMVPVLAQRMRERIDRGEEVRFPDVFERSGLSAVVGIGFVLLGLVVAVLTLFSSGTGFDLEYVWVGLIIGLPVSAIGVAPLVYRWWMKQRGLAVTGEGIRRTLRSGALTVPWNEVRGVRVTDLAVQVYLEGMKSPTTLPSGAQNYVALPALLRQLQPQLPMDWKLKQTLPKRRGP